MGAIGGMLGTAGGAGGTGFNGPQTAPIAAPVNQTQVDAAGLGVGNSLDSSQRLVAALGGQNGIGNQTQIQGQGQALYGQAARNNGLGVERNATLGQENLNKGITRLNGTGFEGQAMGQQGVLNNQLGGAGGVGAQTSAILGLQNLAAQQQGTAQQYQDIANGTGANPAQAMLNQSTGQNVANQAALMAGQRGAGANVGLMARQAAQQGAATQQQAAGQAASMQAQQQIAGLQGLAGAQQAMGNTQQAVGALGSGLVGQQQAGIGQQFGQGAGVVGQQQTGLSQEFGQGASDVGQQHALLGTNAGIAQNQVANQIGATGTNIQGNLGNAGQLLGAAGQYNTTQAGQQANVNTANAGLAGATIDKQGGMIGGAINGAGAVLGAASGGMVQRLADGGPAAAMPVAAAPGPSSSFGQFLSGWGANQDSSGGSDADAFKPMAGMGNKPLNDGMTNLGKGIASRMNAPSAPPEGAMVGPDASSMSSGTMVAAKGGAVHDYRQGGGVKAKDQKEKAVAKGNSYANDKIPAMLSDGEIVIPRSVLQSKDPVRSSADFVAKVMAKRGKK